MPTVTLDLNTNTPNVQFNWAGPGITAANQKVEDPQVSVAGTYTVTITAQNGCTSVFPIIVFADKDGDNDYIAGEEQFIYSFTQQRGNKIKAICVKGTVDPAFALPCLPGATLSSLRIVFTRPSLEAKFYSVNSLDAPITPIGPAFIVLNNVDNNNCRVVIIEPTGQIRVEKGTGQGGTACANS